MLLVIDVGNTNITLGVFREKEILGSFRMKSKQPRTSMSTASHCRSWWSATVSQAARSGM